MQRVENPTVPPDEARTMVIGPSVIDDRTVAQVLDLALELGERELAGGAGAADVSATMLAVARAYALPRCEVDVTFNSIVVSCHRGREAPPITTARVVTSRGLDYTRLAGLDRLSKRIVRGKLTVAEAAAELDELVSGPSTYPRWVRTAALGGMAGSLAFLVGGDYRLALVAAAVTALVDRIGRVLNQRGLPPFFQQIVGAAVVTASAVTLDLVLPAEAGLEPSVVVGAGLTVLLSGLSFVGTVQDAITGFYLTAAARGFEVLLLTAGLVAGIAMLLQTGATFGLDLTPPDAPAPQLWRRSVEVPAAAATAAFFALANYAPARAMVGGAAAGGASWLAFAVLTESGLGPTASTALAAVLLGLVGQVVARRLRLPPLVIGFCGMVPLLPGLTIYQGLEALIVGTGDNVGDGIAKLLVAASVAVSLGAGVVLGEFLAQPVRRRLGRLERRLYGPRMIGPRLQPRRRAR